jgi:branched-chain amino acid transport system substrate-binding protein
MSDQSFNPVMVRSSCLKSGWVIPLCGAMLANTARAAPGDNLNMVRELASRVGPIIGSAPACSSVAPPRVQLIIDKFRTLIRGASPRDAERADVERSLDRYIADGRSAVGPGRTDCRLVDQQIADLTQHLAASNANAGLL